MSEPVNVSHASATSDTRTDASPVAGLVSVIMPLYNGELYVAHAIDSVLAQTYGKVEVVAIDDGSPDKSGEIAARYGDPVRVLSKTNGGVASARNAGFAVARGEYIAFLDQDDWWDSNKLTEQMAIFAANPEVALVHSLVTYYDADGHNALPLLNEHAGTDEIVGHCFDRLLLGNGMYNSSVIVKRAALDVVGVADLSIPGNTVQDYDLWLRVAKQFPFGLVPHSTTMLRIHGEQGIWNRLAMLEAELRVLFKNCPAEDWRDSAARRARLAGLYDAIGVAHLDAGAAQRARPYFRRACTTQPSKRAITRFLGSLLPAPLIDLAKRAFGRSKAA